MSDDLKRLTQAILNYATLQPLDLLSPADIQRDLKAIAGGPHYHRSSIGSDQCNLCLRDLRDPVHMRHE